MKVSRSLRLPIVAPVIVVLGIAVYPVVRAVKPESAPALRLPAAPAPPAPSRTVYPYSVVRGGVGNPEQVRQAIYDDQIVAAHYADLRLHRLQATRSGRALKAHVSYRIDDEVYWTRSRHTIPAGETLIGDGENLIRARCGNRVSETAQLPVRESEPTEEMMEAAPARGGTPAPRLPSGLPDAPYFASIAGTAQPPYVDFPLVGLPPLGTGLIGAPAAAGGGSAAGFRGDGPSGMGMIPLTAPAGGPTGPLTLIFDEPPTVEMPPPDPTVPANPPGVPVPPPALGQTPAPTPLPPSTVDPYVPPQIPSEIPRQPPPPRNEIPPAPPPPLNPFMPPAKPQVPPERPNPLIPIPESHITPQHPPTPAAREAVPEPGSLVLVLAGLAAIVIAGRRRAS